MLISLSKSASEFLSWYFVGVPKSIFRLFCRILILANNYLAVTLNLRLLFTPLFHDFTLVGRITGFVIRLGRILLSIPILLFLSILILIAPLLWYFVLLLTIYYLKLWSLLVIMFVATSYFLFKKDIGLKKVTEVSENTKLYAFRSESLDYLELIESLGLNGINKLLSYSRIHNLFIRLEIAPEKFLKRFIELHFDFDRKALINSSFDYALKGSSRYVEPEHLFLSLVSLIPNCTTFLAQFSSSLSMFEGVIDWVISDRERASKKYFWQSDYVLPPIAGANKGMTGRVTPYLDKFSTDFTISAGYGKFNNVLARSNIVSDVAHILGSNQENVLLAGPAGVGKSSIVKVLAREIVMGTTYDAIKFKRIVKLDTSGLLAGTENEGALAERLQKIMHDVEGSEDIIVFIDEIDALVDSGLAALLEPYLHDDNQFIVSTSSSSGTQKSKKAFLNLFNVVEVPEATKDETLEILKIESKRIEKNYGIIISYPALLSTIELCEDLIHDSVFPAKAVQILDRVVASRSKSSLFLGREDIALEISKVSHVPVAAINQDESEKLLNLELEMAKNVIGQELALKEISSAMKRSRVGIRDDKKPIASFLFVGTTGIGKTQTAKALAKAYFGDSTAMIRLDMSEYQQPDSINRLLGSSDGSSLGQLTEAVRNKPHSLILLDEIEKAYSKILLTFLQVLDDGRLTDSQGNTVDFSNCIIIATSNIGTRSIQQVQDNRGTFEEMEEKVLSDVNENFAPEFLNRFIDIIVFKPLKMPQVRAIAELMLSDVVAIAENKHIQLSFKPELIEEIAKRSYNPKMGARPLAREIEETIETYLADKILKKEINPGDSIKLGMEVYSSES